MLTVEVDKDLKDIFPRYLQTRRDDVKRLQAALAAEDYETLLHLAHKIAGNAPSYGLVALGQMARRLEDQARKRCLAECAQEVAAIAAYLTAVEPKFV